MGEWHGIAKAGTQRSEDHSEGKRGGSKRHDSAKGCTAGFGNVGAGLRSLSGKAGSFARKSFRGRGRVYVSFAGSGGNTQSRTRSQRDDPNQPQVVLRVQVRSCTIPIRS